MKDEPRHHRFYLLLLALAILGSVPFAFIGRTPPAVWGLPLWLLSSMVFTALLSFLTAWGIMRYWKDDDVD